MMFLNVGTYVRLATIICNTTDANKSLNFISCHIMYSQFPVRFKLSISKIYVVEYRYLL